MPDRELLGAALLFFGLSACSGADAPAIALGGDTGNGEQIATPPKGTPPATAGGGNPAGPDQRDPVVHSLANLGDSISQGFDADDASPIDLNVALGGNPEQVFHDNPTLSWVQGTDERVGSVAAHYRSLDANMVITPLSRTDAELVGRSSSVPNLEKQARAITSKQVAPDLVYVLMGSSDVCNRPRSNSEDATATMYSVDEWRTAAVRGLTALSEVLPERATVRFVSMPRVDLLYEQIGNMSVPVIYESDFGGKTQATVACTDLWGYLADRGRRGVCKIVTAEQSAARRKAIGQRIDAYNAALAEEVRRFDGDAARNPKKISFQSDWHGSLDAGGTKNASVGTFVFEPEHISKVDCFHPSVAGHRELAKVVLNANWKP